jgi:hypothetical protein
MNYNSNKYGSSQWIQNVNELKPNTQNIEYKLYPTNMSTIAGGREYIALPSNTKITWNIKEKYNLC